MKIWTVDAFTDQPFKGNPAAICVLGSFPDESLMQSIAAEINLSETAFIVPKSEAHFLIRWFSPKDEAPICAHASLAAAHILWEQGFTKAPSFTFESRIGYLPISNEDNWINMDFPAQYTEPAQLPNILLEALGGIYPSSVHFGFNGYLLELSSEEDLVNLKPDLSLIKQLPCRAVTVTTKGSAPYDFISRYFAPKVGIDEDPVCGSAHCRLGPYWKARLGKSDFLAYQASQRGGILKVKVQNDRVILSGKAITMSESHFQLEKEM